jgi:hypothetical protein
LEQPAVPILHQGLYVEHLTVVPTDPRIPVPPCTILERPTEPHFPVQQRTRGDWRGSWVSPQQVNAGLMTDHTVCGWRMVIVEPDVGFTVKHAAVQSVESAISIVSSQRYDAIAVVFETHQALQPTQRVRRICRGVDPCGATTDGAAFLPLTHCTLLRKERETAARSHRTFCVCAHPR